MRLINNMEIFLQIINYIKKQQLAKI